ncbi:hypothetical protein [Aestuariispira insulae]|uniref:Uncharacterized protein n=1 Tax=Aestuariispira insulae TaxID=1461337 RepID=A0A3D9HNC4_9PROT|nr:hypothetical protein [Aestuariispira insulae]RED50915.1 hypothetical protein DFP90_104187 [Aestuariispira insulae]
MLYSFANLSTDKLSAIQGLEQEIGGTIVAMTEVKEVAPAPIPDEKLEKIRALEKELGVVLVAVQ